MPKKVERCVEQLKEQGFTEDEAWAICRSRHSDGKAMMPSVGVSLRSYANLIRKRRLEEHSCTNNV